jgi:hypothetical protein
MFWKRLFSKNELESGVVDTDETPEDERNYQLGEVVASAQGVVLQPKTKDQWRKFPIFNQDGSGSCVAQTLAKMLGIMYYLKNNVYVHFSATHIYQRRINKPNSGMIGSDAFQIARKGVTLEALVPSQSLTDSQMDGALIEKYKQDVGAIFKVPNYVQVPTKNFDLVASTLQATNKGIMVWFWFKRDEWTDTPTVKYSNLPRVGSGIVRHSVTAVDACIFNGQEGIVVEDSWGETFGFKGQRFISREFFEERNFYTAYAINFDFDSPPPTPPVHQFNQTLVYIPWSSTINGPADMVTHNRQKTDVTKMQDLLKSEGLFPANIDSTGYYGNVTARAVLLYQKKYKVASDQELDSLAGKIVGPKTRVKLNS